MIVRVSTTILLLTLLASTNAVGELATKQTEMWVLFVDRNTYVSARMHDSAPDRMVADEMRRRTRPFGPRTAALMNRGVAIKATRLLRF
jgi:hypothetical protein